MKADLQASSLEVVVAEATGVALNVIVHESVSSTNSWCLQQSKAGRLLPFACFAEEQTSGRGRRGKCWVMSSRNNVAMSIAWPFVIAKQALHLLPLSIALAIVETLEAIGIGCVQIKWPNDVYVQGKKIAGILIETQPIRSDQVKGSAVGGKHVAVVIGLGLNYQMLIDERVDAGELLVLTDICEQVEVQKLMVRPERRLVASTLLCKVVTACRNFEQMSAKNLEKFSASYDFCKQKEVDIILDNKETLSGIAQGVNDNAELLVLIDGEQRAFNSAEVSVRAGKKGNVL